MCLRGISWYGFETDMRVIEGLRFHSMDYYLDILQEYQFNGLRIPISEQLVLYEPSCIPDKRNVMADLTMKGKKCIDILDVLFEKCMNRGIAILLDLHVLKIRQPHPLWYLRGNPKYTEETLFRTWGILLDKFWRYDNFLGIEIINEPHDNASFGKGDIDTDVDWMISRFLKNYTYTPLVFLDGVWWGKDFRNVSTDILDATRVVFSPHFYGPTLAPLPSYTPKYLAWYYDKLLGHLINENRPIVITEWGFNPTTDMAWVTNFIDYLLDKNLRNSFFWSLNPTGKDIQGLLNNWTTIDPIRFMQIEKLCPTPTIFHFRSD